MYKGELFNRISAICLCCAAAVLHVSVCDSAGPAAKAAKTGLFLYVPLYAEDFKVGPELVAMLNKHLRENGRPMTLRRPTRTSIRRSGRYVRNPRSGHRIHSPIQMIKNPMMSNRMPARIIREIGTRPDP